MSELTFEQIKALPKGTGNLFAKTRRWPPEDPRSTFDTDYVNVRMEGPTFEVSALVEQPGYYSGLIFTLPTDIQSGTYQLGSSGIPVRYYVSAGSNEQFHAVSGEIQLTSFLPFVRFQASEFRFVAEREGTGELVEVFLGKFDISSV
ncbi:hypothetical protein [Pseudomonas sp. COW5]|uniref:hypothetical protein n=1 Tax=Pseudomonas sp. COW5 TaxID=2981253 RepID=UPI0022475E8A|nr:hypothetical protein [Pseudomonas sp. COW5]MCX2542049.1 hypothetical protein [Pseudomonas sp. COW5]